MNIIDLTREDDLNAHPTFLEHYNRYWGDLKKRSNCSIEEIEVNKKRVKNYLDISEKLLSNIGLDTRDLSALLVVGSGAANGHALFDGQHGLAWFAVEGFDSELRAKAFVMHELIHALHYQMAPSFWFTSAEEQRMVARQLIIEGIATFAVTELLEISDIEALWGDHLKEDEAIAWLRNCKEYEADLVKYIGNNFESSDPSIALFTFETSDILSSRQGYYIGLKTIERIVSNHQLSLPELLRIPAPELKKMALKVLSAI